MGEVSMTLPTYNVANVWHPSTTATATYSCFRLESAPSPDSDIQLLTPVPNTSADKGKHPIRGYIVNDLMEDGEEAKDPTTEVEEEAPPLEWVEVCNRAEWAQRQTMEEEFSIIATGQTHLGPRSARCAVPYPQLPQASTATRDTITSPSAFLPLTDEV
jgi:hypothetical protein